MKEAKAIITNGLKEKVKKEKMGFRVHFEKKEGHILASGYFPDKGEPLIKTEDKAWELAHKFAKATSEKEYVNIYVINGVNFVPVGGYASKAFRKYNR